MRHRLDIALLFAFFVAFALATSALAQPADLVLRGGRVITVDQDWRIAQAIAIKDGRFLAVGDDAAIAGHIGPNTQLIELAGKTVVPGLIDSHLHQLFAALNGPAVQLLGSRTIADVQKAISERVARTEPGKWVMASSGWHESILQEGRMPTRHELDRVSPDNPVFIPRGGHVITVNSKALELAGITKDTPNPDGGVIVRDANGEATGVLLETAAYLVRKILPPPPANMAELLKIAMRDLNSYGIVGVIEPGIDERQMALYRAVHDAGEMTVRTDVLYRALRKADVEKGIAAIKAQKNDDMLRFVGIKFPLDGGVEGGRMSWPYRIVPGEQTDAAYRGVLLLPPGGEDEYVAGLKLIAEAGLQAQTHAVGDETIDVIVRAYERVNSERPIRDLRWTIMHLFHPSDAALKKMAAIGIMATMQDHPVLLGHNQRRWWGDEHAAYAIPIRKTIDAGVLVGGGTDGPVVPVDPFLSMWWMTTRQVLKGYALGTRARDHREGGADALHHQQCTHHGRGEGARLDRAGQARGPRGAVAGHSVGARGCDPPDEGADDGGRRQGGLSQWDLRRASRGEALFPTRQNFQDSRFLVGSDAANGSNDILVCADGIEILDDPLGFLAVGDELRVVQRLFHCLLQVGKPCRRNSGRCNQNAAELFDIGEEIHHPGLVGIHFDRLENGRAVREEARLGARNRCQCPVLFGLHEIVGGRFRHIERVHLAARDREPGVGAALVSLHDMAIELEGLAGEGSPDTKPGGCARGGPSPLHPGIDRLLDLPDGRIRPHEPEPGRRAHRRQVAELGEVETCGLISRQLREGSAGAVAQGDLQTVRRRNVQAIERNEPAGARLVLDDDRRPQRLGEVGRDHPREDVVASAGSGAYDHPHGLAGVERFFGFLRLPRRYRYRPADR